MDISTEIAAIESASRGADVRQSIVDALEKLSDATLPIVSASDANKILKVNSSGEWELGSKSDYMPIPVASKSITLNGTYDVTDFAEAVVNVDAGGSVLVQKTITENGTYDPTDDNADGYSMVNVSVNGGGACSLLKYFGSYEGDSVSSLTCQVSNGKSGCKCALIIMHRSSISSVSNGMEFKIKTTEGWQYISVYEKIMQSDSETYQVSFSSSGRASACAVLLRADQTVGEYTAVSVRQNASTHIYDLPAVTSTKIAVINHGYNAEMILSSDKTFEVMPVAFCANAKFAIRFAVFLYGSPCPCVIGSGSGAINGSDDLNNSHVFLFDISNVA